MAIGAFGAHGLKDRVSPELLVTFEVGVRYHAYHALALLALAAFGERLGRAGTVAAWCFAVGILIFGGLAVHAGPDRPALAGGGHAGGRAVFSDGLGCLGGGGLPGTLWGRLGSLIIRS